MSPVTVLLSRKCTWAPANQRKLTCELRHRIQNQSWKKKKRSGASKQRNLHAAPPLYIHTKTQISNSKPQKLSCQNPKLIPPKPQIFLFENPKDFQKTAKFFQPKPEKISRKPQKNISKPQKLSQNHKISFKTPKFFLKTPNN